MVVSETCSWNFVYIYIFFLFMFFFFVYIYNFLLGNCYVYEINMLIKPCISIKCAVNVQWTCSNDCFISWVCSFGNKKRQKKKAFHCDVTSKTNITVIPCKESKLQHKLFFCLMKCNPVSHPWHAHLSTRDKREQKQSTNFDWSLTVPGHRKTCRH